MPFLDRFWWLRLMLGGVLLIAALLFTLWYVIAIAPVDLRFGQFGVSNSILAAEIIVILVYAAFVFLSRAQQARLRWALRLDAMAGNREAVPLARPKEPFPGATERTPPWQFSFPTSSSLSTVLGGGFFIFAYGFFLTLLFKYLQLLVSLDGPLTLYNAKSDLPAPGFLPIVPFVVMVLAPVFFSEGSLASAWERQLGANASLCVNEEGIQWRTRSGREHSLKWAAIRLFEVMHQSAQAQQYGPLITWRISILYSSVKAFWWQERASEDGDVRSERFADLARFIEMKTLLQPRTFDPLLMSTVQPKDKKVARIGRSAILLIAFFLPTVLFVATRGVEAAIIAAAVLGGLIIFSLILDARKSNAPATEVIAVSGEVASEDVDDVDSQPDATGHAYEVRVSGPWFEIARVLGIVAGASFSLLMAAALIYGVLESLTDAVRRIADPSALIWPPAIFGGLAAFFTVALIRARATIMRADATGLIQDGPIRLAYIPWNGIISIDRHDDVTPYYQVEGDVGYVVKWPLQTPKSLKFTPSEDASTVTPEELAEIVMAGSGVPITTRVRSKRTQRNDAE